MSTTGGQLEAYCTKCKLDLTHRIISMVGHAVKVVECQTCGTHHLYRRPKTERDAAQARTIERAEDRDLASAGDRVVMRGIDPTRRVDTLDKNMRAFNRWFRRPIVVGPNLPVEDVLDLLNAHDIGQDEAAQDYIMPPRRYREHPGRFRIYGENQDNWYCFVKEGAEALSDPPVYFESQDLIRDYRIDPEDVADGAVLVSSSFRAFLCYILACQICVRTRSSGYFAEGVSGVRFPFLRPLALDAEDAAFHNPLDKPFPAGGTCLIGEDVICVREWGAAFLDSGSRDAFMKRHAPEISGSWP